jgi:hypothetical protein
LEISVHLVLHSLQRTQRIVFKNSRLEFTLA